MRTKSILMGTRLRQDFHLTNLRCRVETTEGLVSLTDLPLFVWELKLIIQGTLKPVPVGTTEATGLSGPTKVYSLSTKEKTSHLCFHTSTIRRMMLRKGLFVTQIVFLIQISLSLASSSNLRKRTQCLKTTDLTWVLKITKTCLSQSLSTIFFRRNRQTSSSNRLAQDLF